MVQVVVLENDKACHQLVNENQYEETSLDTIDAFEKIEIVTEKKKS